MTLTSEELHELGELTRTILASEVNPESLRTLEERGRSWDEGLWSELSQAGIVGVAIPEEQGGLGFGLAAICEILRVQGAHVAPVPLWTSLLAHRLLAASQGEFTSVLTDAATGLVRTTLALEEPGLSRPAAPETVASKSGEGWVVEGEKVAVPHAQSATHFLVSARTPDGSGLFLLDRTSSGLEVEEYTSTDRGHVARLVLDGVEVTELPGEGLLARLLDEVYIALAALQHGVGQGALELTAKYVTEREQFGRPIGTFQSLQHQLADAVIALDAIELTTLQALAHMENGDERASRSARVASWWARTGGTKVTYTCQHVHGGIGVDIDYPLHRYFLWARQVENTLGNANSMLGDLGADLLAQGARL